MSDLSVIDHLTQKANTVGSDLFRFCLSDQVSRNLTMVVNEHIDPVSYAGDLLKHDHKALYKVFPTSNNIDKKYRSVIKQMSLYDPLVYVSALYRLGTIFPNDMERVMRYLSVSQIYLLNVEDTKYPAVSLSGFTMFNDAVKYLVSRKFHNYRSPDSYYLEEIGNSVSSIKKDDWLFWDPNWQPLLLNPRKLKAFRYFLHAVFSCFMMPNHQVEDMFGISYDDILCYAYEFIEMRKSFETTPQDVIDFVERLRFHFDVPVNVTQMTVLLESSFSTANLFFIECGENVRTFHQRLSERAMAFTP